MPMYNLLEYSSNYSGTTGSLWFYSQDGATNLNADIENTNAFKSFKYKAKFLGDTVAQPAPNQGNGILKNATIVVPLKYLCKFLKPFKMALINCKIELKLRWKKHFVFCVLGNENDNANVDSDNIVFTIKHTKLYVPVSQKTIKNYQNSLAKDLKDQCIGMNIKQKVKITLQQMNIDIFLKSNFVGNNRLFVLVFSSQDNNSKRFKVKKRYLPKGVIKNNNVIINGKKIWRNKNLTTGQGEDYITGCLLDYEYIKNDYRLLLIDNLAKRVCWTIKKKCNSLIKDGERIMKKEELN